jgi:hypothetical protein
MCARIRLISKGTVILNQAPVLARLEDNSGQHLQSGESALEP